VSAELVFARAARYCEGRPATTPGGYLATDAILAEIYERGRQAAIAAQLAADQDAAEPGMSEVVPWTGVPAPAPGPPRCLVLRRRDSSRREWDRASGGAATPIGCEPSVPARKQPRRERQQGDRDSHGHRPRWV